MRNMGVNGHAEGHGGGGNVPDANGTSQHYHVAEDDQTLEEVRRCVSRHIRARLRVRVSWQHSRLRRCVWSIRDSSMDVSTPAMPHNPNQFPLSEQGSEPNQASVQTYPQEFLTEEQPAVEEESYPEPTAAVDDVLEQVHSLWHHAERSLSIARGCEKAPALKSDPALQT